MKIAIITSGGDAPGMNACVRAIVRYALSENMEVCGFGRGYLGILEDDYVELDRQSVSNKIGQGGTFLMTERCPEFEQKEKRLAAGKILRSHKVDALVVIGGDGTFRGAAALAADTGIRVIGIPGTIDNDLAYTERTLGFDTAVNTVLWAINSLRDTMHSHNKVTFVEVMGRHCGDIALHAGITGGAEVILVPEVPFDMKKMAAELLDNTGKGKKSNLIVVAEGAGKIEKLAEEFKALTGIIPRTTRLGFIQRGGSPSYADRLLASKFGIEAVKLVKIGESGKVIGIRGSEVIVLPIEEAIAMPKTLDKELYEYALRLN